MLYILEYRRADRMSNFEFCGVITILDGRIVYRYKEDYEEMVKKELEGLPPDLAEIARSGDDVLVSRKSVIYSEDDIDTLFQELVEAERRLRRRRLLR